MSEVRDVRDPRALRALAHQVRLKLLEELAVLGTATATELAEQVGESPANCSWHLRQLARYGFVEEAGGGTGRQRPWRIVAELRTWDAGGTPDPELALAGVAASEMLVEYEVAALRDWYRRRRGEVEEWRRASFQNLTFTWLTLDELADLKTQLTALLSRHVERLDPAQRPPGAKPVRLVAWGFPARPIGGDDDG